MTSLPLWQISANTPGLARRDHPATARAAAASVAGVTGAARTAVLAAIQRAADGLTDEEIVDATGLGSSTVRPRRVELARAGLIVARGERKTRSGRGAQVWYSASGDAGRSPTPTGGSSPPERRAGSIRAAVGGEPDYGASHSKEVRHVTGSERTAREPKAPRNERSAGEIPAGRISTPPHDAAQPGPRATPDADRAAFRDGGGA